GLQAAARRGRALGRTRRLLAPRTPRLGIRSSPVRGDRRARAVAPLRRPPAVVDQGRRALEPRRPARRQIRRRPHRPARERPRRRRGADGGSVGLERGAAAVLAPATLAPVTAASQEAIAQAATLDRRGGVAQLARAAES